LKVFTIDEVRDAKSIGARDVMIDDDMQTGRVCLAADLVEKKILEPYAGVEEFGLMSAYDNLRSCSRVAEQLHFT
jgi:hypothetical protein